MAEIIATSSGRRSKRRPLRPVHLDMAPLVDLGFLLLTFFILTTHLLDQRVMSLTMPLPGPPTLANNTLTILLAGKGAAFGYQGAFDPTTTRLQPLGGKALRNTLRAFRALNEQANTPPVCIVKAAEGTRYAQVVDAVDELNYAGIERFSVQDSLFERERTLLATMPE
ncbi:MAG: biopolymer transporter ExbD [Flavobacteriales bacterium]